MTDANTQVQGANTPPAADSNQQAQPKVAEEKTVKVRVLAKCEFGEANDVISIAASKVKQAQDAGLVDSNKAAVEYAEGLKKQA